ncbi:pyridoxal phosphate-dependent aminotransferase [Candidatus Poriferisocius sp.]|uniref:pyridoxal phosphate-dependent aminotransferase n=1 Tax=Candidatus Poriferisocius sp. TaxID=3101276 RepID=UPI003B59D31A
MPERLLNPWLVEFGTTIFAEMSALATATGAINLGQGFPDTDGPAEVADAAVAAIRAGHNQYPPGLGIADLRLAVAEHQERFYGLEFDPDTEVLITAGATEAIAGAMLSLLVPGDEVVLFEPYYDSHVAGIAMARAERRLVTLRPPHYRFDPDELAAAIGPRTRMMVVNSPHNPTGKVFDRQELEFIAELCRRHDLLVVTDEVYEHLAYDGTHIPLATLPGMRERTITVSSAGKTFSFTGWKVGWVCAPAELRAAVTAAKQFLTYVNGAPFQHAVAVGLRLGDDYFDGLRAGLRARRDQLTDGLAAAGFEPYRPAGTYFVTADVRPLGFDDGMALCRRLPELCGVVAVPNVVFYDNEHEGRHLVRFAFCKRPEVLEEAVARLSKLGDRR